MLKTLLTISIITVSSILSAAQSNTETFAGYSLLKTNYDTEPTLPGIPVIVAFDGDQTMHGLNVAVTRYVKGGFGITGDFSWHIKKLSVADPLGGTIDTKIQVYNFLAGGQYKFARGGRVSPFVRALAGAGHTRSKLTVGSLNASDTASSTDLALAIGGGLDVRVNDRFAVRAVQADWNPIFMGGSNNLGFNRRADNFRLSFGVVFR